MACIRARMMLAAARVTLPSIHISSAAETTVTTRRLAVAMSTSRHTATVSCADTRKAIKTTKDILAAAAFIHSRPLTIQESVSHRGSPVQHRDPKVAAFFLAFEGTWCSDASKDGCFEDAFLKLRIRCRAVVCSLSMIC